METGLTFKHWWCGLTSEPAQHLYGFLGTWYTQISFYFSVCITRVHSMLYSVTVNRIKEGIMTHLSVCATYCVSQTPNLLVHACLCVRVCVSLHTFLCVHSLTIAPPAVSRGPLYRVKSINVSLTFTLHHVSKQLSVASHQLKFFCMMHWMHWKMQRHTVDFIIWIHWRRKKKRGR